MRTAFMFGALACVGLSACVAADTGTDTSKDEAAAEAAESLLVAHCDYLDTASGFPVPAIPVNFDRELVIRDLNVVNDPCRTTLTPTVPCLPGTVGVWTFSRLMSQMAGTVPPSTFIADWLRSFEVNNVVNGFPVPLRPLFRAKIIDPWLVASGCAAGSPVLACPLDLTKAPLRLLAIVNRVDLSSWTLGAPPTRAGEARFVFGFIDPAGAPFQGTVILEYRLPNVHAGVPYSEVNWAADWHVLSDPATGPLGSPTYNAALQNILSGIVTPGSQPGNPNLGSAIGQVRTNEIDFGPAWKLREYRLKPTGAGPNAMRLRLDPLDQTPNDTLDASPALDAYLNTVSFAGAGSPELQRFWHVVPVTLGGAGMQGGEATAPPPGGFWNPGGGAPLSPLERHHFGFGTCSGCHTGETGTLFTHIGPRPPAALAPLSPFLAVSPAETAPGSGMPAAFQTVADPAGGPPILYNEPFRRVCEVSAILGGHPVPYTNGNGGM